MMSPILDAFITNLKLMLQRAAFEPHADGLQITHGFKEWREVLAALQQLKTFEAMEENFKENRPGASVSDCIGWIHSKRERMGIPHDLADKLEASLYEAVLAHLRELHGRRQFADAQAEAERKARQAEYDRQRKEYEEQNAKRQREQAQRNKSFRFEDLDPETIKRWSAMFDQMSSQAFYGGLFGAGDPFGFRQQSQTQQSKNLRDSKWYEMLGVSICATKAEINKAYRKLAQQYHPDKPGGSTSKMAALNAARDEGLSGARV